MSDDSQKRERAALELLFEQVKSGKLEPSDMFKVGPDVIAQVGRNPDNAELLLSTASHLVHEDKLAVSEMPRFLEALDQALSGIVTSASRAATPAPQTTVKAPAEPAKKALESFEDFDQPTTAQSAPAPARQKAEQPASELTPAVPIHESVLADGSGIICLEDGVKVQILTRHLNRNYNMTPEEYIARWNLPADYPMTSRQYSEMKRASAIRNGLGRSAGQQEESQPPVRRARATQTTASVAPRQRQSEQSEQSEAYSGKGWTDEIKNSVLPDGSLICLVDGKNVKMLRRHLKQNHNMSEAQYRRKYNLPDNYPMVAPAYTDAKRKNAIESRFGTRERRIIERGEDSVRQNQEH